MQLAITLIGFVFIGLRRLLFSQTTWDSLLSSQHEWTICFTLGAFVAWLGVKNSGKWIRARICLATSLSSFALSQYFWNFQELGSSFSVPGIRDFLVLLTSGFLFAYTFEIVKSSSPQNFKQSYFLDFISIAIILTIAIFLSHPSYQGYLDFHQITFAVHSILILTVVCVFLFFLFLPGEKIHPGHFFILVSCVGFGVSNLDWTGRFLRNQPIDDSSLNTILSIAILTIGYVGSRWIPSANNVSPSFSLFLGFLPFFQVSISSVFLISIWKDKDLLLSLKLLSGFGTVAVFIFASIRQLANLRERQKLNTDLVDEIQSKPILSEKLILVGKLVGNITHEINTPLSAILTSSGTIKLLLAEKLDTTLQTLRSFTEREFIIFFEILNNKTMTLNTLDSNTLRVKAQEMIPLFEKKNMDVRFATECLSDFGYDKTSVPKSLLTLESNKIEEILLAVKFFIDSIRANEIIHESTKRSDRLIKSMKKYLHDENGSKKEETNLHQQIQKLVFLYYGKYKEQVTISIDIPKELVISCFVDELNQVWVNLINNSLDAMNYIGEINISAEQKQDCIEIQITDDGPGISPEVQPKIFQAFFTTKKVGEGTGLGLAITKSIIEKHNGSIHMESNGFGTKFHIQLPLN